jgi:hypothetical protein
VTLAAAQRTGNVDIFYRTVAYDVVIADDRVSEIKYLQYAADKGPATASGSVRQKCMCWRPTLSRPRASC